MNTHPKHIKKWRIALVFFVAFLAGVTVCADLGILPSSLRAVPYSDKIAHLLLYGTLFFIINKALGDKTMPVTYFQIPVLTIPFIGICFLEEFSQAWFPLRSFTMLDFLSSLSGVAIVIVVINIRYILWKRKTPTIHSV